MPFTTFGIFDKHLKKLIDTILEEVSVEASRESLVEFFYNHGIGVFCRAELSAIAEPLKVYLHQFGEFPHCFPDQVTGYKFMAFQCLRKKLLESFPADAHEDLGSLYDSFCIGALTENNDFFKLEAAVRTSLKEFAKNSEPIVDMAQFNEYFIQEYQTLTQLELISGLKEKLYLQIEFLKQNLRNPVITPKSKAMSIAAPVNAPSNTIPTTVGPARSKSLNDKPTTLGGFFSTGKKEAEHGREHKPMAQVGRMHSA